MLYYKKNSLFQSTSVSFCVNSSFIVLMFFCLVCCFCDSAWLHICPVLSTGCCRRFLFQHRKKVLFNWTSQLNNTNKLAAPLTPPCLHRALKMYTTANYSMSKFVISLTLVILCFICGHTNTCTHLAALLPELIKMMQNPVTKSFVGSAAINFQIQRWKQQQTPQTFGLLKTFFHRKLHVVLIWIHIFGNRCHFHLWEIYGLKSLVT